MCICTYFGNTLNQVVSAVYIYLKIIKIEMKIEISLSVSTFEDSHGFVKLGVDPLSDLCSFCSDMLV